MECATEMGASAWVTTLPIVNHGFFVHKRNFRDAISLCYGWSVSHLPHNCCCGSVFSVDHAMTCHKGGYPSIRHNEIWDVSSDLLAEVFTTLVLNHSSSLSTENPSNPGVLTHKMKLGVTYVPVVFGQEDRIHSLMWVFYPNASSYCNKDLAALYKLHENAKKSMEKEYRKLNMLCLPLWSCRPVVASCVRQQHSTRSVPQILLSEGSSSTASC